MLQYNIDLFHLTEALKYAYILRGLDLVRYDLVSLHYKIQSERMEPVVLEQAEN